MSLKVNNTVNIDYVEAILHKFPISKNWSKKEKFAISYIKFLGNFYLVLQFFQIIYVFNN